MAETHLPAWAEHIRSTYLRGEASVFLLHGNVFDLILHKGELISLTEFLTKVLLEKKKLILHCNTSVGVRFRKKEVQLTNLQDFVGVTNSVKMLSGLEKLLHEKPGVGLIIDYAEMLAPAGDKGFMGEDDRKAAVTLHRWSLDPRIESSDSVIILVTEQLSQLADMLVANPRIATLHVPLPDMEERRAIVRRLEPDSSSEEADLLAAHSAGLKNIQIRGILAPGEDAEEDYAERYELIREVLRDTPDALNRARKLTRMTSGMTRDQVVSYLRAEGLEVLHDEGGRYDEVLSLLAQRKREILEKECFGLVEFVEPNHDFSAVGGMTEVKRELLEVAANIKKGNRKRVPMGLLFTGPMGTGKTFVAEAFAKSSGLTAIKLKNFRSKWVGATEGNLEKILGVVKAIGNVLLIIDEGDRSFGNAGGDNDGGTSSRVIARLKEFMSDTTNRGRVLFVLMTNRPDKLDIDIKRAGRLDRKIPFFYASDPEGVEPVISALLRRHGIKHTIQFPDDREAVSQRMVGYSNADIEAILLAASNTAERNGESVSVDTLKATLDDYLPSRDERMLEYMEILAVFESSSRALLPPAYAEMSREEMQERLQTLRALVG